MLDRGAQANVRGATHVLDRGVQAVARGAARCALHVHRHDVDAGVVDAGFNSWLGPRLTCGSMLEVSRDAVAAGEKQLVSCAAE